MKRVKVTVGIALLLFWAVSLSITFAQQGKCKEECKAVDGMRLSGTAKVCPTWWPDKHCRKAIKSGKIWNLMPEFGNCVDDGDLKVKQYDCPCGDSCPDPVYPQEMGSFVLDCTYVQTSQKGKCTGTSP